MDINGMKYRVQKAVAKEDNIQTELLLIFLLEGEMTIRSVFPGSSYVPALEDDR